MCLLGKMWRFIYWEKRLNFFLGEVLGNKNFLGWINYYYVINVKYFSEKYYEYFIFIEKCFEY